MNSSFNTKNIKIKKYANTDINAFSNCVDYDELQYLKSFLKYSVPNITEENIVKNMNAIRKSPYKFK